MKYQPIVKVNSYTMPIHLSNGSTVVTPFRFAIKQRVERLKRELRINKARG